MGSGELCVDPDKVSAVADGGAPQNVKAVKQFPGFAYYYN